MKSLLTYDFGPSAEAFSTHRDTELPYQVHTAKQTHGREVLVITHETQFSERPYGYDALVTNLRGMAIGVRTADCVPVLILDPVHNAIAAVHSGWKGTVLKVSHAAVSVMMREYKTRPEDLIVHIGPCICAASFQVGEEVATKFKESGFPIDLIYSWNGARVEGDPSTGHHIDLVEANKWLLVNFGVLESNIHFCGIDTLTDASFFSARREGTECGRIINSIKLL